MLSLNQNINCTIATFRYSPVIFPRKLYALHPFANFHPVDFLHLSGWYFLVITASKLRLARLALFGEPDIQSCNCRLTSWEVRRASRWSHSNRLIERVKYRGSPTLYAWLNFSTSQQCTENERKWKGYNDGNWRWLTEIIFRTANHSRRKSIKVVIWEVQL